MSKEIADKFRRMADRIEKNADEPFAGVALIVPPGEEPETVELLKLDPKPDATAFWAELSGRCQDAVAGLTDAARSAQAGFPRRR